MEPTIRCLLLMLGVASLGCASDYGERYRLAHPGWTPEPPHPGGAVEETLASIHAGAEESLHVSVGELRVLRVDVEPWETLSVDSVAAEPEEQIIGVIAHRRCWGRQGIHFFGSKRASWYLFVAGELTSFDHFEFGDSCAPENHYLPSSTEHLATERALVRYAARRYPESAPTTEEMLSKGMALVSASRLADAKKMLRNADRELDLMAAGSKDLSAEEKEAFEERERRLRAMRARLSRAIAAAERQRREDLD
jgi:hypothetical protein